MQTELNNYITLLENKGAISPKVVKLNSTIDQEIIFSEVKEISPDLKSWFSLINGYDEDACLDLDVEAPDFLWQMHLLSLEESQEHYEDHSGCGEPENPDYWPLGFIPILWGGSGDYIVINSIAGSKTYGAVYEMTDGVGVNRISNTIANFLSNCSKILELGLIQFEDPEVCTITDYSKYPEYLYTCQDIFNNPPYFSRLGGQMDTQIIDWK